MKTREQLLYEMAMIVHNTVLAGTFDTTEKLLDLIVSACEEIVDERLNKDELFVARSLDTFIYGWNKNQERILKNLKKLKSK